MQLTFDINVVIDSTLLESDLQTTMQLVYKALRRVPQVAVMGEALL